MENAVINEGGYNVWKDGKFAAGRAGIASAAHRAGYVDFEIGSGSYAFLLTER